MRKKETASRIAVALCLALIAATGMTSLLSNRTHEQELRPHIRSIINMGRYDPHNQKLLAGYNYFLLSRISEDSPTMIDIRLADEKEFSLDSLMGGAADILVLPFDDSTAVDSSLIRIPVDSAGLWLLAPDMEAEAAVIRKWVAEFQDSDDYAIRRQPFFGLYDPFRKISADFISPYDSLIKVYADSLEWDWKLLAAVIYQESNFRIEARSSRGAQGLMQMVASTARHFKVDDVIDPEQGIQAGMHYLRKLSRRYDRIPKGEREKFVLGAYNAGEGRIKDCINYARYKGVDDKKWDEIVAIIPEMRDSTIAEVDTVKLGQFQGYETIAYVDRIMDIYNQYKRICQ